MKCLSIREPWASLIVDGYKDCENRQWSTAFRGWVLIHASKTVEQGSLKLLTDYGYTFQPFSLGCIIGVARLVTCTRVVTSEWHDCDQVGWYLTSQMRIKDPIPLKGQLGLFDVDPNFIAAELKKQGVEL